MVTRQYNHKQHLNTNACFLVGRHFSYVYIVKRYNTFVFLDVKNYSTHTYVQLYNFKHMKILQCFA